MQNDYFYLPSPPYSLPLSAEDLKGSKDKSDRVLAFKQLVGWDR